MNLTNKISKVLTWFGGLCTFFLVVSGSYGLAIILGQWSTPHQRSYSNTSIAQVLAAQDEIVQKDIEDDFIQGEFYSKKAPPKLPTTGNNSQIGTSPVDDKQSEITPTEIILEVPLISQKYKLSCEAASMEMVLSYFDISRTQDELMNELGYSSPIISTKNEKGEMIWGDPDEGFVGNVDGRMIHSTLGIKGATGLGTTMKPVSRTLQKYLPNTTATKGNKDLLKSSLSQKKPVIWWHVRDDANPDRTTYLTPKGKKVDLFQYHVAVIIGFTTDLEGNTSYIINDPYFGRLTITEEDMLKQWEKFNYQMVVAEE